MVTTSVTPAADKDAKEDAEKKTLVEEPVSVSDPKIVVSF